MEWCLLILWALLGVAEHLTGGRLVDARGEAHTPDGFQELQGTESRRIGRCERCSEGSRHEALGGEVVHLIRTGTPQRPLQGGQVGDVPMDDLQAVEQMGDALGLRRAGATQEPIDVIALLQEQLSHVGAVLATDAGDERSSIHEKLTSRLTTRGWVVGCGGAGMGFFARYSSNAVYFPSHQGR